MLPSLLRSTTHAKLALAAIVNIALPHYVFPVWPGLWLVLTWSLSRLARHRGFPAPPVAA